jgi:hypothetical protein
MLVVPVSIAAKLPLVNAMEFPCTVSATRICHMSLRSDKGERNLLSRGRYQYVGVPGMSMYSIEPVYKLLLA